MNFSSMDYLSHLEDEIALEGLDGITIEGLWVRLNERHNFTNTLALDDNSKEFLWSLIVQDEEIEFFSLQEPRAPLKIFNRYEYIDPDTAMILEPNEDIEDIYPISPVDDEENGIRGSCATYNTRKDITDEVVSLRMAEALEMYGHKLVMVASQSLRNKALCINAAIDKFYDLILMQYIMLEHIGRSRTMGEITHGKNSLAVMNLSPKSMFYYRKRLLKLNLITKQSHRQRSVRGNISSSSLLHLTRFYVIRRPKCIMIIQKVVEILQRKPNHIYPLSNVKNEIGMQDVSSKKIFKNAEFSKYIQSLSVPYRQIHKNATEKEWRYKVKNEEKMIRCLQLINPELTPEDVLQDEDEEEDGDEDDASNGILDQSNLVYRRSLMYQAFMIVDAAGPEGVSQIEMSKKLGQTKLDSRTICRNLQKRGVIHTLMKDIGRQRVSRHVSNRYASTGHLLKEFETERKKMMDIVENTKSASPEERTEATECRPSASTPSTSRIMESDSVEGLEIGLVMTHSGSKTAATVSEEKSPAGSDALKKGGEESAFMVIKAKDSVKEEGTVQYPVGSNIVDSNKSTYINEKKVSPHLTTRMMKRANIIMNAVRKHKVIDDAFKLQKLIIDSELLEGSEAKMDKKSLMRLLDRLSRSGFLKKIVVKIKTESKMKAITFVVDSSITLESNLLKAAIEQQKHKFLVQSSTPKKESGHAAAPDVPDEASEPFGSTEELSSAAGETSKVDVKDDATFGESMLELKKMHNVPRQLAFAVAPNDSGSESKVVGIKGNVGPKFVRMQKFHKLLFYLVYGYEGQSGLDQEQSWKLIVESCPRNLSEENLEEYPPIFLPELSWKMFIPPLPKHATFPANGWIFVVDLLLRLPLCIFVHIVNVVSQSKMLTEFLNHPVKQNMLVKSLPPELRRILLNGRRYVTYVMDLCRRLCYTGLLQMGRQLMKEKDQIFVYLNRKATLVDTSVSNPGYHHISLDKEYVRTEYTFHSIQDVIQYWYDMWTICMHTPLGGHMCVEGKKVTIQVLSKKPEMIESLKARTVEEASLRDDGRIPGDERGAAGLDSAMFSHLKRNWSCSNSRFTTISQGPNLSSDGETKSPSSDGMFSYAQYLRNSCRPSSSENSVTKNRLAGLRNVRLSLYKPKRESEESQPLTISVGLVESSKKLKRKRSDEAESTLRKTKLLKRKKSCYQREIKARNRAPKKPYYDEEDKAALRRMNKLRVDWYPAEDSLLLLCKVSSSYLFPNKRSQVISFCVVRDLLHSRFPESRNKTSRACQRRINYILKNPATEENVAIILEEIKQDEEITQKYKPTKLPQRPPGLNKAYVNLFKELVDRLVIKYASNESKEVPDLPDTYEEFEKKFRIIKASNSLKQGPKLEEIKSRADIDHYVVNALIFSSLCTKQDRESWAYQLYLAYQKYPQNLLNSVLSSIRDSKMISYKKCYNRSKYTRTCLPLSTSPFQLSLFYIYRFHMKYQYEIFGDCWSILKKFLESKKNALHAASLSYAAPQANSLDGNETPTTDFEPVTRKGGRKVGERRKSTKALRGARVAKSAKRSQEELEEDEGVASVSTLDEGSQGFPSGNQPSVAPRVIEEKGIQLPINIEGGCCAAIIGLMATRRVIFDITIPDQMILIDNQTQGKAEKNKLLEKVKMHEMISGRKFVLPEELGSAIDEDIYTEKDDDIDSDAVVKEAEDAQRDVAGELLRTEGTTEAALKGNLRDDSVEANDPLSSVESTDNEEAARTNSASLENVSNKRKYFSEEEDSPIWSKKIKTADRKESEDARFSTLSESEAGPSKEDEESKPKQPKIQTSSSRIRMYMMREQMDDSDIISYWAFDNIYINTCEISCKLRNSPEVESSLSSLSPEDVANTFMPVSQDCIAKALALRKRVVLHDWTKLEPALATWEEEGRSPSFLNLVKRLFEFIESKKDFGASTKEIKEAFAFPECGDVLPMKVVCEMEEVRLVLKVGVETFRWVTIQYAKTWLIRTNKMSRSKMNSSEPVRLSGVYEVKGTENAPQPSDSPETPEASSLNAELEDVDCVGKVKKENGSKTEEKSNLQNIRPRMALLKSRYRRDTEAIDNVEKALDQHLAKSRHEEIDVLVRPWVRLNGCLNRRVMDRMLGAILCFVMEYPGTSGYEIADKFWPALQPAHTYELLETLVVIEAVSKFYIRKSHKVTLFSEPQELTVEPAEDFDTEDSMNYEAEVDCVLKLAMFIGDKKYSHDFLTKCR